VTLGKCRKYAASAAKNEAGDARDAVCRAMKHSARVRDSNYVYRTKAAAVENNRRVKNVLIQQQILEDLNTEGKMI